MFAFVILSLHDSLASAAKSCDTPHEHFRHSVGGRTVFEANIREMTCKVRGVQNRCILAEGGRLDEQTIHCPHS